MADGKKEYSIVINGITQSVSEVDALLSKLNQLEQRMQNLQARPAVSVGGSSKDLTEQDKLLSQIAQKYEKLNSLITGEADELMQVNLALKEEKKNREASLSSARLEADNYGNTMADLKKRLADVKKVMNFEEIGSDRFKELVQEADILNHKLMEIEKSYGQFGRNVGNYANGVYDGLKAFTVKVGDVERTFTSTREATKSFEQEIKGLSMAGKEDTKEFQDLTKAYHDYIKALQRAESAVNDLKSSSSGMDDLMDIAESFGAIGQITQGFSAFFGQQSDITKSIQELMALQSVLQGIEKLRKQMNTGEGLMGFLTKGNTVIDKFTKKLFGVRDGLKDVSKEEKALQTQTEETTATMEAQATAEQAAGTGAEVMATKMTMAEKASKALSIGLKAIGMAALVGMLMEAKKLLEPLADGFMKLMRALTGYQQVLQAIGNAVPRLREIVPLLQNQDESYLHLQEAINGQFDERVKYLQKLKEMGKITEEEFNDEAFRLQNEQILKSMEQLREAAKDTNFGEELRKNNIASVEKMEKELNAIITRSGKNMKTWADNVEEAASIFKDTRARELGQNILAQYAKQFEAAVKLMQKDAAAGEKAMASFWEAASNDAMYQALRKNLSMVLEEGTLLYHMWELINEEIENYTLNANRANQASTVESVISRHVTQLESLQKELQDVRNVINESTPGTSGYTMAKEAERLLLKDIADEQKKALDKEREAYKKRQAELQEHYRFKISIMKDGLLKTLAQIDLEYQENLRKAKEYGEDLDEVDKRKDEKILDAKRKFADESKDIYLNMLQDELDLMSKDIDDVAEAYDRKMNDLMRRMSTWQEQPTYYGNSSLSYIIKTQNKELGLEFVGADKVFEKRMESLERYWDEANKIEKEKLDEQYRLQEEAVRKEAELRGLNLEKEYKDNFKKLEDQQESLKEVFIAEGITIEKEADNIKVVEEKLLNALKEASKKGLEDEAKALNYYYEAWTSTTESVTKVVNNYDDACVQSKQDLNDELAKLADERKNTELQKTKEWTDSVLSEYRMYQQQLSTMNQRLPVINLWGDVSIKATRENGKKLLEAYQVFSNKIYITQMELKSKLDAGEILRDDYDAAMNELSRLTDGVGENMEKLKKDLSFSGLMDNVMDYISKYANILANSLMPVIHQLWENQDAETEAELERLDKEIEAFQEKYDQLADIISEYADKVNDTEDELATARGDRREHLIDQLNAEKKAQREALKEQQRVEAEKRKAEERAEALEQEQRKQQHERDIVDAVVAAALATVQGFATKPFVPVGLAMGSLAASLGAVQVALIRSQKYAEGGLLQGKSHAQGGIKVLGGTAEVEGNEYITNKRTTMQNLELMDFINSKKKRLNLSDFVEFYGNPIRNNIKNVSGKFANGGQLPSLRNDISLTNSVIRSLDAYANRQVVVSVVDIVDRQTDLNEVKVLAGL